MSSRFEIVGIHRVVQEIIMWIPGVSASQAKGIFEEHPW